MNLSDDDRRLIRHALTVMINDVNEYDLAALGRDEIDPAEWGVNEDDGLTDARINAILDQRCCDLAADYRRLERLFEEDDFHDNCVEILEAAANAPAKGGGITPAGVPAPGSPPGDTA